MEGQESQINFTIEAKSYYQPEKGLSVVEERVQ
jgi:hypothetical protein